MDRREVILGGLTMAAVGATSTSVSLAAASPGRWITRRIPSTGEELPVLGLGTSGPFEVGGTPAARDPLKEVLEAFFAAGAKLIDTSPMYSTAEGVLGELLTPAMQSKVFLATKVWTRGERDGVEQMTKSGELLRHPKLDLIQVHNLLDLDTHLKTLRQWKEAGPRALHRHHALHRKLAVGSREDHRAGEARLRAAQLFRRHAGRRDSGLLPLAADKGVACAGEPPVRGRDDVQRREG